MGVMDISMEVAILTAMDRVIIMGITMALRTGWRMALPVY